MALSSCTKLRYCGLALAALFGCASPAFAQAADRPHQGLFGEPSAGTSGDNASLTLTIAEAYDQDVSGAAGLVPTSPQTNRLFTRLAADFSYRADGRNVQFASTAGGNFRYYSDQDRVSGVAHHAGAGLSANLSRTTSLLINQTVAYSPSYLYRLFASVAPSEPGQANVGSNYGVNDNPSYSYDTNIAVTQRMGRRNRLSMAVGGRYTDYVGVTSIADDAEPLRDLMSYETGVTFIRDAGRSGHVNLGYTFKRAQYLGSDATAHGLNIGFDYDRPLSPTRRTQLKFSVGSVMLQALAVDASQGNLRQRYQFSGDMALSRQFGRTWQASGAYRRSVGFMEGFSSPVLLDAITVSTTGRFSPRADLLLTASYSLGDAAVARASTSSGFSSYTGNVRTRVALTSFLAVYGEYLYYFYDFSNSILLPIGAPPKMSRNSAHLGLTVYVPMGRR